MAWLHNTGSFSTPPAIEVFEALAREAFATIPDHIREVLGDVVIRVQDFPDDDTLEEMDCESPFDLLGLYRGVDMIYLYRRPILDYWCETGDDLAHVVRHVLIHEIGHHFGFSDDDMERIEFEAVR